MTIHNHTGKLTPSKENYLKVMLDLPSKEGIRSTDIASALGVSKASVSSMMNILREAGYVIKEKYGTVSLTKNGRNAATEIKRRNELLKRFLHNILGVEASIAAEDACRLEHLISPETADQIDRQLKKLSE